MWRTLLITAATAAGLSLSVVAVQAQRTDTDVDEGLLSAGKPSAQQRNQATTPRTRTSVGENPRARGRSKTWPDCRPAGSRRCTTPTSR